MVFLQNGSDTKEAILLFPNLDSVKDVCQLSDGYGHRFRLCVCACVLHSSPNRSEYFSPHLFAYCLACSLFLGYFSSSLTIFLPVVTITLLPRLSGSMNTFTQRKIYNMKSEKQMITDERGASVWSVGQSSGPLQFPATQVAMRESLNLTWRSQTRKSNETGILLRFNNSIIPSNDPLHS